VPTCFFQPGEVADPRYAEVRDRSIFAYNKVLVEQIWREYAPVCPDSHFLEDAKSHFHSRTWEMYVAHVLRADGFALERPPHAAPDIRFRRRRRLVHVEAIAAERGEGPAGSERWRDQRESGS
jgi:hypothetical protein